MRVGVHFATVEKSIDAKWGKTQYSTVGVSIVHDGHRFVVGVRFTVHTEVYEILGLVQCDKSCTSEIIQAPVVMAQTLVREMKGASSPTPC